MQEANLYKVFLAPLNQTGINYMVTGSVACIIYGQPRMTHDIDLVLNITASDIHQLVAAFPQEDFYCPPESVIKTECSRETRGHFNLIHHASGFKADVYPVGREDLMKWGFNHKKQYDMMGEHVWVAPPEYVIVQKLQYYHEGQSSKHVTDIQGILKTSEEMIDYQQLSKWVEKNALKAEWNVVKDFKS